MQRLDLRHGIADTRDIDTGIILQRSDLMLAPGKYKIAVPIHPVELQRRLRDLGIQTFELALQFPDIGLLRLGLQGASAQRTGQKQQPKAFQNTTVTSDADSASATPRRAG